MTDHEFQLTYIALRRALFHLVLASILFPALALNAQETDAPTKTIRWGDHYLRQKPEWYATAEARRIADHLLQHQSPVGGWPKSVDFAAPPTPQSLADAVSGGRANSLDNDATTEPMQFLARIAQATGDDKYRQSFGRGLDYLFAAQYPNGGWPQFFPLREGYYSHITFNDGAMIHALTLLRDVAAGQPPYDFVDADRRAKASAGVTKGIDCILRTQIKEDGKLTAWCAQHDEKTLAPAWARNYEIPSLSGAESVGIVRFLMEIEQPTPEIIAAVEGAVAWLKAVTITGLRYERGTQADGKKDGCVKPDPTAGPLWARFYELGTHRPIFTGRDKIVRYALSEIERERRGGYAFYGDWAETLLAKDYPRWAARHKINQEQVYPDKSPKANAPDFSLVGFATVNGGTTGGAGGKTTIVATLDEFRVAAGTTGPLNILVAGTLDFGGQSVKIGANKTIIGLGTNAGFVGHVYLHGASNIILRNLNFTNPKGEGQGIGGGDGMTAHSTHHVWVDHCNFGEAADGQFDITHGSDFITVSWCKFSYTNAASDHRLSMLIGNRDDLAAEDTGTLHVTLHHNWIGELVQDRAPRVRFGQVHVLNNYYNAPNINTCIGLGCGSQVLAESCHFDGMKRPWRSRSEPECIQGRIQWNNDNIYNHPKLTIEGTNSAVFQPPYVYKLDAGKDVKRIVTENVGVGKGPFAAK